MRITINNIRATLGLMMCFSLVFTVLAAADKAYAADQFTIESKTNTQNVNGPIKLKLIASANGDIKAKKTGDITDPNSGIISVPFNFKKKNDIVTAGFHDEFFVCGYILDAKTGSMISCKCKEPDLQNEDGNSVASLDSFITIPEG